MCVLWVSVQREVFGVYMYLTGKERSIQCMGYVVISLFMFFFRY